MMTPKALSLLGGQIVIPAYITLPTYVVVIGAILALIGALSLFVVWIYNQ